MIGKKVYRAKGVPPEGGRERFITTVWRRTPQEAQEDIAMYGGRYTKHKIQELDWQQAINKKERKALPRMR